MVYRKISRELTKQQISNYDFLNGLSYISKGNLNLYSERIMIIYLQQFTVRSVHGISNLRFNNTHIQVLFSKPEMSIFAHVESVVYAIFFVKYCVSFINASNYLICEGKLPLYDVTRAMQCFTSFFYSCGISSPISSGKARFKKIGMTLVTNIC